MYFDEPEQMALERISVLLRDKADWHPYYAWSLGKSARRYADLCTSGFRETLGNLLEEYGNKHALYGWLGQPKILDENQGSVGDR